MTRAKNVFDEARKQKKQLADKPQTLRGSHMYLATAPEMNAWDTATIEMGMPAFSLMENASREIWHALREIFVKNSQSLQGKRVLILAGGGNNGGDAIALARLLHDAHDDKSQVLVVHTHILEKYQGMAQEHAQLARACSIPFMSVQNWLSATERGGAPFVNATTGTCAVPHIIIDGLLGTGFQGPLRGNTLAVIERINSWLDGQNIYGQSKADHNKYLQHTKQSTLFNPLAYAKSSQQQEQTNLLPCPYILAIDSPSGIDSTTGTPSPIAIAAHATVTFEAPKVGLVLEPARPYVGNLMVRAIGIPSVIQHRFATKCTLLHADIAHFLPDMNKLGHKGDAGHVLVIGGSKGLTGAAHLSAKAALRTGAGLVSMAVPAGLEMEAKCSTPDIMVMGVGNNSHMPHQHQESHAHVASAIYNDGHWPSENLYIALHGALDLATRCTALVLGPGIGRSVEALAVVQTILSMPKRPPAIIDADALFALSHHVVLPASHKEALYGQSSASLPPNPLLALIQKDDILTPHPTEAARMLNWTTSQVQADRMGALKSLTNMLAGTVILKGACTLIGQAQDTPSITVSPFIEPHLSVAGSGDVLAGIIASLVAQGVTPSIAARLGVFLHVKTGALLAQQFPKRGNMASDMVDFIPQTLHS